MEVESPWRRVTEPDYFLGVLASLVDFDRGAPSNPDVVVRFGRIGDGLHPNYRIEEPGKTSARRADNHQPDTRAHDGRYEEDKLSPERLKFKMVQEHIKSLQPG